MNAGISALGADDALARAQQAHRKISFDRQFNAQEALAARKPSGNSPVDEANHFASQAELAEKQKETDKCVELNWKACKAYLVAAAEAKRDTPDDPEAEETYKLLADTHKRKAKLIEMRQKMGVQIVKGKTKGLI